MSFLESEGYSKSTADRYINCFKTLIGIAERENIHTNHKAMRMFRHSAVREHEKTTTIYGTFCRAGAVGIETVCFVKYYNFE